MKFRKRVKLFPGFHLNISNSGLSSTIGTKGVSINFSKKGTYLNTSIPGTGFYNREKIGGENYKHKESSHNKQWIEHDFHISPDPQEINGEIKSNDINKLTSSNLLELQESLEEVYNDRIELSIEIKNKISTAKLIRLAACIFIIGFFVKSFKERIIKNEEYLSDLENQLKNSFIDIDINFDQNIEKSYNSLISSYKSLLECNAIWDITSSIYKNRVITRSAADTFITRVPVKFKFDTIDIIKSTYSAFHFENKNGGDLYIYPTFVIITTNKKEFALIDIKDLNIIFSEQRFLEEEIIPLDTKIIDKTWAKVNKNGTPDRRFKDNYEIPIVSYGNIQIISNSGLNEVYAFSSYEKSANFYNQFTKYQRVFK